LIILRLTGEVNALKAKAPGITPGPVTKPVVLSGLPSIILVALGMVGVKRYFGEQHTEGGGVELEALSRRERSGSLLPKSRAKSRDLVLRLW
jgi:hypothetical protein